MRRNKKMDKTGRGRRKKRQRDPRINVRHTWQKEFAAIYLILMVINGGYTLIFMTVYDIQPTLGNMLPVEMFGYMLLMTFIVTLFLTFVKNIYLNKPMKILSAAVKQIAQGDFTVRMKPLRKDGKKDAVEVMFEDFNKMAEELSSIETLKNDFIINVSHEIKTPLAVIQNYAQAMKREAIDDKERMEYADTIVTASRKLTALVTNILKLNKLENQEIVPVAEPYDLSEQLRCCALAFEDLWEKKNIVFTAEIQDDVIVCYDESMMEIVWNNLISNAVKFTENEGRISVKMETEEDMAVVTVKDSGCGMNDEVKERLFDKFYQGDSSHAQEGNGLGLALVKRVIDIAEGKIEIESESGQGTLFKVKLKKVNKDNELAS